MELQDFAREMVKEAGLARGLWNTTKGVWVGKKTIGEGLKRVGKQVGIKAQSTARSAKALPGSLKARLSSGKKAADYAARNHPNKRYAAAELASNSASLRKNIRGVMKPAGVALVGTGYALSGGKKKQ